MDLVNFIKSYSTFEELQKALSQTVIQFYEDPKSEIVSLYTNHLLEVHSLTDIEKQCRNILINKKTLEIVAYSQPKILYNDYIFVADSELNKYKRIITECFEGSTLMMYYYDDKWSLSTRKYPDANQAFFRSNETLFDLFKDCIDNKWSEFCSMHDTGKIYLYVLVHHKNIHLINYTSVLGPEYKKLVLIQARHRETFESILRYNFDGELVSWDKFYTNPETSLLQNIITPKYYTDYGCLDEFNETEEKVETVDQLTEVGVLIYTVVNEREYFVKLQTSSYQMYTDSNTSHLIPKSSSYYISLYQQNKMDIYLQRFSGEMFYITPEGNEYQVKGLVDCLFKVMTSELLYLFKYLWDIRNGIQKEENKDLYYSLTSEYKKIFYLLRGIYFSKRAGDISNRYVTVRTVYELLKSHTPVGVIKLFKDRRYLLDNNPNFYKVLIMFHNNNYLEKALKYVPVAEEYLFKTCTELHSDSSN